MNPKRLLVPFERGRDPESYLIMGNGFLLLVLELIYAAKDSMRLADPIFFAFISKPAPLLRSATRPLSKIPFSF